MAKPGEIKYPTLHRLTTDLNHSGWAHIMPRGITPSDIDFLVAINGRILFGELKSNMTQWHQVATGQLLAYQDLVRGTKQLAALCYHRMLEDGQQIDTITDIESYQIMYWSADTGIQYSDVRTDWPQFVNLFGNRPSALPGILCSTSASQ